MDFETVVQLESDLRLGDLFPQMASPGGWVREGSIMFPFWYELSGSQLLQWTASAATLLLCLVNLAAGQRSG